jgi:hypothetical protein
LKDSRLVEVVDRPFTRIGPVVAPTGTFATIVVALRTMKDADTSLNVTLFTALRVKFAPVIVTRVPTRPWARLNEEIVRAACAWGRRWSIPNPPTSVPPCAKLNEVVETVIEATEALPVA